MKKIKRKIAVLLLSSLLVPYMRISLPNQRADSLPVVKAETISEETEWNIKYMNAEKAYEESRHLKRIKVAVLDSGLDYDEDISFVERKDFLGEGELHPIYQDQTGHGTSVAGLICAKKSDDRITGIAANVDLYAGRILDAKNKAPVERAIEGIRWAMDKKVDIIHMSYGTRDYDEELEEVIQQAYDQGILIIAAAGNDGTAAEDESTVEYPAAFDNVISVGATNTDNKKTEISSSGYELDVVAPGDQILASGAFGGVVVEEGTSVSAAQVTGVAAVLWGKHPDKTNEFIKGLLVSGANAEAVDENCGQGIIDYEQSEKNYAKMSAVYQAYKSRGMVEKSAVEKAEESVGENRKEIRETDGVNYVNGAWEGKVHAGFVTTGSNINIVKAGAVAPDHVKEVMKGLDAHPCFHGGGNYFANTQYIYAVARSYINAKTDTEKIDLPIYEKVFASGKNPFSDVEMSGMPVSNGYETQEEKEKRRKKNVRKQLETSMTKFFEQCLMEKYGVVKVSTNQEKGYALLGAAIHNLTDAFSHRACLNVGEGYGGWRQVVHDPKSVDSTKQDTCAAARWEQWSKGKSIGPIKSMFSKWKNTLICADDVGKLEDAVKISQQLTSKLITSMMDNKENFYEEFEYIIRMYDTSISSVHVRVNKLNSYWNETYSKIKNFYLNVNPINFKLKKPKKDAIDIKLLKDNRIQVIVDGVTKNTLCEVSGKGEKGKRIDFVKGRKSIKNVKKPRNVPCWTINKSNIKGDKIKVEIYSTSQRYSITKLKKYVVKFSKKGIKINNGKSSTIKVKIPKKISLELGKMGTIKKLSKYNKNYKLKEWYALINGNKVTFEKKASFQSSKAGEIVLHPIFVKKKKGNKK